MFETRIVVELSHEDRKLLEEVRRQLTMFVDSLATLTADVNALIAQNGNEAAAIAAAVAAKDAQDAAALDALDVTVKAALLPATPAAPVAPAPAAS